MKIKNKKFKNPNNLNLKFFILLQVSEMHRFSSTKFSKTPFLKEHLQWLLLFHVFQLFQISKCFNSLVHNVEKGPKIL